MRVSEWSEGGGGRMRAWETVHRDLGGVVALDISIRIRICSRGVDLQAGWGGTVHCILMFLRIHVRHVDQIHKDKSGSKTH